MNALGVSALPDELATVESESGHVAFRLGSEPHLPGITASLNGRVVVVLGGQALGAFHSYQPEKWPLDTAALDEIDINVGVFMFAHVDAAARAEEFASPASRTATTVGILRRARPCSARGWRRTVAATSGTSPRGFRYPAANVTATLVPSWRERSACCPPTGLLDGPWRPPLPSSCNSLRPRRTRPPPVRVRRVPGRPDDADQQAPEPRPPDG